MNDPVIQCTDLFKDYQDGVETHVLKGVSLRLGAGESLAIVGASGSGKSTLLQILGGLDSPTQGEVRVVGKNIHQLSAIKSGDLRNQHLGFVYQFHHLLAEFTAVENVAMPLLIRGIKPAKARAQAEEILQQVGLGHRLEHKPGELSGGERQRAAIARALVTKPACVLADEPTGNLDSETAEQVFDILLKLKKELQTSFIIVTHDKELAGKMDRVLRMDSGVLSEQGE